MWISLRLCWQPSPVFLSKLRPRLFGPICSTSSVLRLLAPRVSSQGSGRCSLDLSLMACLAQRAPLPLFSFCYIYQRVGRSGASWFASALGLPLHWGNRGAPRGTPPVPLPWLALLPSRFDPGLGLDLPQPLYPPPASSLLPYLRSIAVLRWSFRDCAEVRSGPNALPAPPLGSSPNVSKHSLDRDRSRRTCLSP